MSYRDKAQRALESRAASRRHDEYLKQIKDRYPALEPFENIDELLALLRDVEADPDAKDAVLLALIEEHQRGGGGGAFALLSVAMFPALDRLYHSRIYRSREHDDLWGRVIEAFAEALDRYPIARRPARVAANIDGETMAALRRARLRELRTMVAQDRFATALAPFMEEIEAIDPSEPERDPVRLGDFVAPGREPALPPDKDETADASRAVMGLFDEADLSEQDRFVLLGVHLYKQTLGEVALRMGISREAAKKRHLRAISRLRERRRKKDLE